MFEVLNIYTAPTAGAPMVSRTRAEIITGLGIRGDRYALQKGSWIARGETQHKKKRNVTLIDSASIRTAKKRMIREGKKHFFPHETRRNLLVNHPNVLDLVGKRFRIGRVEFVGIEHAKPCARPGKLCGKTNFSKAFFEIGGLNAEALTSGEIKIGDRIEVLE